MGSSKIDDRLSYDDKESPGIKILALAIAVFAVVALALVWLK